MSYNFHKHFPFEKEREIQTRVLDHLSETWEDNNIKLLNLPTGVGKSCIAIAVSHALKGKTIISTPQKILQDQYMKDFGNNLLLNIREMKGRNNFQCITDPNSTCADGPGAIKPEYCPDCPYIDAKKAAEKAKVVIMNFAYYMTTSFNHSFNDRPTLIIDEAHSLPEHIIAFAEFRITDIALQRLFDNKEIRVPELDSLKRYEEWMKDVYDTLSLKCKKIEKLFKDFDIDANDKNTDNKIIREMIRDFERYNSFMSKINRYFESKDYVEWVWSFEEVYSKKNKENAFILKPLTVDRFAKELIFDRHEKIILMSATLLEKKQFCSSLGISQDEAEWIEAESPFPTSNHKFLMHPIGSLNAKEINDTLPKLIPALKLILASHEGQKGIIHCGSFKIANYIRDNLKDKRLLIQESGQANSEIYTLHKELKHDTVIVSPSMAEGIDLIGDLGQFQIIVKLPFMNLGDKWTRIRAERFPDWYLFKCVLQFVQAMGRTQRTAKDKVTTYVLDQSFNFFMKVKGKNMLPTHIKKICGIK